ncbi:Hsp70 family protein [Corynebacterium xerosis]|uniref:Hsp70 family protein n=1 Tax=Corynebacterium xerosis TaxID=1725 RepID=A0ABV3USQ2_9CORY
MSGWRLAIDFGTSNTAAAHRPAGAGHGGPAAEALALSHHGNLLPSAVFADGQGLLVGHVAMNQAESRPDAFLPEPKRAIGSETVLLAGSRMPVVEVVAAVIGSVLERARRFAGGTMPDDVVLTHPEGWGQAELVRLIEGAERAGIERRRLSLVSEPRAATYWYSFKRPLSPGQKVAVFDLGGGTLDVAVLTPAADGSLQVVAARGDNSLGGRTLDARIRSWVESELEENDTELLRALQSGATGPSLSLDRSIRTAKEVLSEAPRATITVAAKGRETTLMLTRGEFEELIKPDIDRALDVTRATMLDAGLRPDPSTPLYLTGGSARVPYVQDRLGELCQVATLDDPKTVVSRGALMGPTRRADDVVAGVTTWIAPGAIAAGAGPMAVSPMPPDGPHSQAQSPAPAQPPTQPQPQQQFQPQQFQQSQPQMPQQPYRPVSNPYGQQPGPQNAQQHQSQPQQFAAVPSSSGTKSGNSKTPLIAIGAIAALLLVGGIAWAAMSGGDEGGEGNGNGGGTSTGASESTAPGDDGGVAMTGAPWPNPMPGPSDYKEATAAVDERLPNGLTDGLQQCSATDTSLSIGMGGERVPGYLCGYESDVGNGRGPNIFDVMPNPDIIEVVRSAGKRSSSELEELFNADGKAIYLHDRDSFAYFYYVDDAGGYVYESGHFETADDARAFLRDRGLI